MSAAAITQPCQGCGTHFVGLSVPGLCPACEKDSAFYKATRKKGDPRQFLPYPDLLDQWRRRRAECRQWQRVAEEAAADRAAREQAEREKSYLLAALGAVTADLDPALALAAELAKVREELQRERVLGAHWREQAAGVRASWEQHAERLLNGLSGGGVPPDQWRRLVQLVHPDKHAGSAAAMEATRWLLENRP